MVRGREILIIGAGPAGLAAAAFAPGGAIVLEGKDSPGWKILISAGGRCNVTNTLTPQEILRRLGPSGRPLKTALGSFGPDDVRAWLAGFGCPTVVRDEWHVYPKSNRAEDVLAAALRAVEANDSAVLCGQRVTEVTTTGRSFAVGTQDDEFLCRKLLIASGTPAWGRPQPHFDDLLRRLGHTVRPWVPGLCPIPLKDNPLEGLEGVPFVGRLGVAGAWDGADELLITDDGLSGPAVLDASARIFRRFAEGTGDSFEIDFVPGQSVEETVKFLLGLRGMHPRAHVTVALAELLPKRLAERLASHAGVTDVVASQLTREDARRLARLVHSLTCRVLEMPSLAKAFVASGGIPLEEVDPRTMESRIVPGLFFAGEILDYDAPSGGFNMTLALSTGRLAALAFGE